MVPLPLRVYRFLPSDSSYICCIHTRTGSAGRTLLFFIFCKFFFCYSSTVSSPTASNILERLVLHPFTFSCQHRATRDKNGRNIKSCSCHHRAVLVPVRYTYQCIQSMGNCHALDCCLQISSLVASEYFDQCVPWRFRRTGCLPEFHLPWIRARLNGFQQSYPDSYDLEQLHCRNLLHRSKVFPFLPLSFPVH